MEQLYLTRFEVAKIIGVRANQLSRGAPPMVDITGLDNALDIATKEYTENVMPFTITRKMPNGEIVDVDPNTVLVRPRV